MRVLITFAGGLVLAGALASCGPVCGPDTCKTCCTKEGQCVLAISDLACGASGFACNACFIGESCLFGRCMQRSPINSGGGCGGSGCGFDAGFGGGSGGGPTCGPLTCGGCCLGDTCMLGGSQGACGSNGFLCQKCATRCVATDAGSSCQ